MEHQRWLWERALGRPLRKHENEELLRLGLLQKAFRGSMSGRTNWLGGTPISREREASMFNCAFTMVETVYDVVDCAWNLLQGCGQGFEAVVGSLNGFPNHIESIEIIRSKRTSKGGFEHNNESYDRESKTWTIMIGDSAKAWAKAIGKLVATKHYGCKRLVIDLSQIRPAGQRLKGYGWISSGDEMLAKALWQMCQIMNERAEKLLRVLDIHDIITLIGTILSSRRSAQLSQHPYGTGEWVDFAHCKSDLKKTPWRVQSNNNLYFMERPTLTELKAMLYILVETGGSDPGIFNMEAARKRAPWCRGTNPCGEILLPNKGFCNLVEVNFGLEDDCVISDAVHLFARANYRQTLVDLQDGILQRAWHENNQYLRLCGVGPTGIEMRQHLPADWLSFRDLAICSAALMADEVGQQRPKAVTTVKPSGTLSKVMDTTSGFHRPGGQYIFNDVTYSRHDSVVKVLRDHGYMVVDHPDDPTSVLVRFTESWPTMEFSVVDGLCVDTEPAVQQLKRYRGLMRSWCDHNVSCTIYYEPCEIHQIAEYLHQNWDDYVGVSFLPRADVVGKSSVYSWMPQRVVSKEDFEAYSSGLTPIDEAELVGGETMQEETCASGSCPIN